MIMRVVVEELEELFLASWVSVGSLWSDGSSG
jgi:hypothetical protein